MADATSRLVPPRDGPRVAGPSYHPDMLELGQSRFLEAVRPLGSSPSGAAGTSREER